MLTDANTQVVSEAEVVARVEAETDALEAAVARGAEHLDARLLVTAGTGALFELVDALAAGGDAPLADHVARTIRLAEAVAAGATGYASVTDNMQAGVTKAGLNILTTAAATNSQATTWRSKPASLSPSAMARTK